MGVLYKEAIFKKNFLREVGKISKFSFCKFVAKKSSNFIIEHYFTQFEEKEKKELKKELEIKVDNLLNNFLKEKKLL